MNILKQFILISIILLPGFVQSQKPIVAKSVETQNVMSPELMWQLGRVSPIGLSKDGKSVIYRVSTPNMDENKFSSKVYSVNINGGTSLEISDYESLINNKNISPDGKFILSDKSIKIDNVHGFDRYPDLKLSTAQVYTSLDYRHWDTWNDGHFNHVFMLATNASKDDSGVDIMKDEPFNCPTKPFGGDEDYIWHSDGNSVVYVSKKLSGTQAAQSTNTDLYQYNIKTGKTENLTESNKGYDTNPSYSENGDLAYLSMKTDGYEADKNDIKVISKGITSNLTAQWDGTVNSFIWANDNRNIYFTAPANGTIQLFKVDFPGLTKKLPVVEQLTDGEWDITGIVGQNGNKLVLTRTSMNRAAELYTYDIETKSWSQLTDVNKKIYDTVGTSRTEKRYVTTTDGKKMLVWVVYPPNFDPTKKYPALLYCQGGPQSALTQFYSFRWNLQLMASQGYIVVAPNRRGMPGHGVEWNHQISKDWGGQNIKDYLSAIDDVSKEAFVDKSRLGAVGASYGGYSVFYLAGIHEKRFKTFIAHDGVFNTKSMYGTTEEMFFVNYDFGGPYWEGSNKTYTDFNPINHVAKWDTPIYIIQGGKDYRVPIGQGLEAFNAAQLRGIKSKLLYLPDENHWVMKPQNSLVWQREFFQWLKETL
ncbi:MAG TPA: S9 family peptidase [Saprospiraceae bacterium]|nr:S9 family peptidase [Saprospiraceae bacterium]